MIKIMSKKTTLMADVRTKPYCRFCESGVPPRLFAAGKPLSQVYHSIMRITTDY